jgi:phosphatidylglycerol:prolipoprotein diacylglycerol transferase
MALPYPQIDPVIVRLGPVAIRWYAMAYIAGLVLGWRYLRWLVKFPPRAMTALQVDDFLTWATLGVIIGGRLGYVMFYKPQEYFSDPIQIVEVWRGGMSFHGGATGVLVALVAYALKNKLDIRKIGDTLCVVVPIGLFFGRVANFINDELWGRAAPPNLPWAMQFPNGGPGLRHPSQLYEAGLEGLVLLIVMHLLWRDRMIRMRAGTLAGCFLLGYGCARIFCEFFREPDDFLGFLWGGATMGQILSLPMVVAGLALILWPRAKTA